MPAVQMTRAVRWLLIVTVAAFLCQLIGDTFLGLGILETFQLTAARVFSGLAVWQVVTYAFMHSDLFHILLNMLILWMIGTELEDKWGTRFFLKYYFFCILAGAGSYLLVQSFFKGSAANYLPLVGSSAGVYGLLVAYGIIYSERVLLFMMIFPMKAKHFVILLAAIEFISTVFYSRSGIANAAHLGGMIAGFSYLFLVAYLRIRAKNKKSGRSRFRKSHLKLVVNNEIIKDFEEEDQDHDRDDDGRPTFH